MSFTVTKFELELNGLTPTEKAVAHSLAFHAHPDGSEAYPSMDTIAAEAGIEGKWRRRTAQRIVRQLEKKGVIVADSPKSGGRNKSTHYRFNLKSDLGVAPSMEAGRETATLGVGNCDIRGQKLRPGCRTKDPEGSINDTSDALASKNPFPAKAGKFTPFPENFEPNDENRVLANKLGVDIKESQDCFADYQIAQGRRSADWHREFNVWLRNSTRFAPRKPESKAPDYGSLSENVRLQRERLGIKLPTESQAPYYGTLSENYKKLMEDYK